MKTTFKKYHSGWISLERAKINSIRSMFSLFNGIQKKKQQINKIPRNPWT